jgi:hypothetical protein
MLEGAGNVLLALFHPARDSASVLAAGVPYDRPVLAAGVPYDRPVLAPGDRAFMFSSECSPVERPTCADPK